MENNWPETIEELLAECQMLVSKTDLYELGERGEPFTGEIEPRVDGTDYLAGEYQYGVAMIPAQWVTHVLEAATLGRGECKNVSKLNRDGVAGYYFTCSECGLSVCASMGIGEIELKSPLRFVWKHGMYEFERCPRCGKLVKR